VRSCPRSGKLKKSRRNRGALHGDFHISEANVFANYAFAFAFRSRFGLLTCLARKGAKDLATPCCKGAGIEEIEWLPLDHAARETPSRLTSSSNIVPSAPWPLELR
jgi:hypothetical protein